MGEQELYKVMRLAGLNPKRIEIQIQTDDQDMDFDNASIEDADYVEVDNTSEQDEYNQEEQYYTHDENCPCQKCQSQNEKQENKYGLLSQFQKNVKPKNHIGYYDPNHDDYEKEYNYVNDDEGEEYSSIESYTEEIDRVYFVVDEAGYNALVNSEIGGSFYFDEDMNTYVTDYVLWNDLQDIIISAGGSYEIIDGPIAEAYNSESFKSLTEDNNFRSEATYARSNKRKRSIYRPRHNNRVYDMYKHDTIGRGDMVNRYTNSRYGDNPLDFPAKSTRSGEDSGLLHEYYQFIREKKESESREMFIRERVNETYYEFDVTQYELPKNPKIKDILNLASAIHTVFDKVRKKEELKSGDDKKLKKDEMERLKALLDNLIQFIRKVDVEEDDYSKVYKEFVNNIYNKAKRFVKETSSIKVVFPYV